MLRITIFLLLVFCTSCSISRVEKKEWDVDNMLIRIAALTIDSAYIDEYINLLQEEAAASVAVEPGVICIYPMFVKENPNQIRLLEIYLNQEAYEAHLKTPHFLKYKNSTLHMVESLELIDMESIDKRSMQKIFRKL